MSVLPDQLRSGDVLKGASAIVTIHRTIRKDGEGNRLYRLRYSSGVLGNGHFTRDDLQELECELIKEYGGTA